MWEGASLCKRPKPSAAFTGFSGGALPCRRFHASSYSSWRPLCRFSLSSYQEKPLVPSSSSCCSLRRQYPSTTGETSLSDNKHRVQFARGLFTLMITSCGSYLFSATGACCNYCNQDPLVYEKTKWHLDPLCDENITSLVRTCESPNLIRRHLNNSTLHHVLLPIGSGSDCTYILMGHSCDELFSSS